MVDEDSGTTVRLQLWDTAGQERFRSITKLYYRGANAVVLVYSILDEGSFHEMTRWLRETKENIDEDVVLHVVGTKSDLVAQDPSLREVAFERCIAFVADAQTASTSSGTAGGATDGNSKRSSGFWAQDVGWNCCHEISASSGEGIEEVFRVITRKLVEQSLKKKIVEAGIAGKAVGGSVSSDGRGRSAGSIDGSNGMDGRGSFRIGIGDKRRSWLGLAGSGLNQVEEAVEQPGASNQKHKRKGCC